MTSLAFPRPRSGDVWGVPLASDPSFLLPSFLQSAFLARSPQTVLLAPQSRWFSQAAFLPHDAALPEEGAREGVTDRHTASRAPQNLGEGHPGVRTAPGCILRAVRGRQTDRSANIFISN